MTDEPGTIWIRFPEGGCWEAGGLGYYVHQSDAASHVAGDAPHRDLIDLIAPVLDSDPDQIPETLTGAGGEWLLLGRDEEDANKLVYERIGDEKVSDQAQLTPLGGWMWRVRA